MPTAGGGSVTAIEDHGVALAILTDGLPEPRLRIQCECGWYDSCAEVINFDAVARSVNDHRKADDEIAINSGVSLFDGSPFVVLRWGIQSGQLDPLEAEQHGLAVIAAAIASRIDAAVMAELTESIGLDKETAARFLVALRKRTGRME